MKEKNTNLSKKIAKIPLTSPHLAAMNNEFTTAWRGEGVANDPVPNLAHGHRVILPTGA